MVIALISEGDSDEPEKMIRLNLSSLIEIDLNVIQSLIFKKGCKKKLIKERGKSEKESYGINGKQKWKEMHLVNYHSDEVSLNSIAHEKRQKEGVKTSVQIALSYSVV